MSVSSIINPATGKIYDELAPQGGGVPLAKGGLITADATGKEQALAVGNDGWVLSANSNVNLGLEYIQLPAGGIQFTQEGQLLYAGAGPAFQDSLLNIGNAGQILGINAGLPAWINAGGSGTITALAPLTEYADGTASKVAIDFTAKGDLVVGGGVQVGGNPVAGVILPVGANDMVLTANSGTASGLEWKAQGGGSSATIYRNSVDNVPLPVSPPATANDTCVITADRTYHTYSQQVKNTTQTTGANVNALAGPITFFSWTAPSNIFITSYSANVYIVANAQLPEQLNDNGTCNLFDAAGTTILIQSDLSEWNIIFGGLVNFPSQAGSTLQVVQGTTYLFIFELGNAQGVNPSVDLIDTGGGNLSGNITINGLDYAGLPTTFTINVPTCKFREANDLTGKTSATCESFASQSFVASEDLNSWICVGARNGGVAFVP
ncbi:hypothetical protein [Dishui Lake virophage 8]|nr:hypothetical protein [Dishui Lake virophage 8]